MLQGLNLERQSGLMKKEEIRRLMKAAQQSRMSKCSQLRDPISLIVESPSPLQ